MDKRAKIYYEEWRGGELQDQELLDELLDMQDDEKTIEDCFYRDLEFGTGGLRGIIGVGTNRMNIYTVGKATQGYCDYLKLKYENPSVAIAYDSRIKSNLFAKRAAEVFAANGIRVYIYPELMPTPALSFAVRYLKCSGGIVITASHNPARYNGYKVYGSDGCQITTEVAGQILKKINETNCFTGVKSIHFEEALGQRNISYISEDTVTAYINAVTSQTLCPNDVDKNVSIVYTPLNGAGLSCVRRVLRENGFTDISIVKEQELPDGRFLTCPFPNPEIEEALELGLRDAKKLGSELLLATDPDCDRVGIAVKSGHDYELLSGNEVGMLMFDYICKRRKILNQMPENPVLIKTIVTIDLVKRIADDYGVKVIDVLTGFKFIGEQIGLLEALGEEERYVLGFEESYGYLTGTYVRDKDAVSASLMICEMFAYYKAQHLSFVDVLNDLYNKYGYCKTTLHSYEFEGADGSLKMQKIMNDLRNNCMEVWGEWVILSVSDFKISRKRYASGQQEIIELPESDVLKFHFEDDLYVVVRPSGTEPKLKIYFSVKAKDRAAADVLEQMLVSHVEKLVK